MVAALNRTWCNRAGWRDFSMFCAMAPAQAIIMVSGRFRSTSPIKMKKKLIDIEPLTVGKAIFNTDAKIAMTR